MANTKISALPAVATPAGTDQFPVNQGGVSKKVTLQQISGAAGSFNPAGTSRIQVNSTTQIQLNVGVIPLFVNSIWQTKPVTTAVTISNGGLSANTTYFVYAFDSAGTLTLEIVTTAHAIDATYGVEIKSGDATRTLVGMVRTNASSQFVQSANTQWFAISYFNRHNKALSRSPGANRTTTSGSGAEFSSSDRLEFLTWAEEGIVSGWTVRETTVDAAATAYITAGIDGTTSGFVSGTPSAAGNHIPDSGAIMSSLTEGYHYCTFMGAVGGGTLTLGSSSTLSIVLRG